MSQSPDPVRFAYVGCGFMAQKVHIPNFAALPDCRFLAVAELRHDLAKRVAARYGIPKVYRSHQEIAADPDIEAVGVSAPFALQGKIAEELARAGKHVFMEKPMAVSVARAQSIVDAVAARKVCLMVGYMKRYDPGNLLLKKHADEWRRSGEAGRLLYARAHGFGGHWLLGMDANIPWDESTESAPPGPDECPDWLPKERRQSYLDYLQQWTHNLNLLRFFLDDTAGNTRVESVSLDPDGMTGLVILNVNGVRAVIESAYTRFHAWEEHTQLYFEGGWLRTQAPALMQKEIPATVEIYGAAHDGRPAHLSAEYPAAGWPYREEAKYFLNAVRTGHPTPSSAQDTLHDVRLFEEIYKRFLSIP